MERGELRLWDALAIAQSIATLRASPQDQRFDILFLNIADHLHALGTSQMSPRTLIDTLCLFEVLNIRPKALYVDVMHQLVRQTTAMYPDELTGLLVTMARIGLSSPAMLDRIAASIRHNQLQNIRYLHGCELVGAMAALGYDNSAFYVALDSRMKMCAEMMPVEEVWDTVKYLPSLQYSWKPYERSIWDELSRRTSKFYNELHVDEVSDPVSFMQFLRLHKRLDKRFMSAMAAWARVAVYRPTSRTSRRPTARELALIVDYCQEYGVGAKDADNKHVLHKAVRTFVGSRGGQQETKLNRRPLLYMRRRRYNRADDPYVKANLRPLTIRRPLRNGGVWKSSREAQISSAEGGARKAMWNYWLLPEIYQMFRVVTDRVHAASEGPSTKWQGPFSFVQMADTQLGMYRADEEWSEEVEMASRSISYINRLKPKFVVVCGDLINAWPDQADVRKEQVQSYKELMGQIDEDIPLLCLCGNHDVGNRPNSRTIALYSKDFGDDYYTFTVGGVLFVVTNSILPWGLTKQARDGEVGPDDGEELDKKQWEWLEGTLKEASAAKYTHIILLTHVSPFIRDPEEHEGYFNMPLPVRKRLLRLASEAGVKAIFAGHYHRNAGGWYTDSCGHRLEVVTTTAIGCQINSSTGSGADPLELSGMGEFVMDENRCGLRQVDVSEEAVSHKFITVAEMMKCSENPQ